MSRSFKKNPVCTGRCGAGMKTLVHRGTRAYLRAHHDAFADCGHYKRFWNSWDICEYHFRTTWGEWLALTQNRLGRNLAPDEVRKELRSWAKDYRSK